MKTTVAVTYQQSPIKVHKVIRCNFFKIIMTQGINSYRNQHLEKIDLLISARQEWYLNAIAIHTLFLTQNATMTD